MKNNISDYVRFGIKFAFVSGERYLLRFNR